MSNIKRNRNINSILFSGAGYTEANIKEPKISDVAFATHTLY